jgi:hypothetical protein
MFQGVSTNGTSVIQIQIGAGSVTTTGYLGSINLQESATSATLGRAENTSTNIRGSKIYIGGNYLYETVYINNLPFVPFSSASSFFNQW